VGVLSAILPGNLSITPSLSDGTTKTQGVFIEMFLTAGLCLSVLMLAVEKQKSSPMAPVGIGFTLMIGHLVGVVFTGGWSSLHLERLKKNLHLIFSWDEHG
jgi:aquaporin rerated protein, other eukaryote